MGMRTGGWRKVLDHLRLADGGLGDAQLLARFLDGRDEAAFAALVRRHGPMVLGVCRRLLGNVHDAEDAFQASFLLLARKAAAVVRREAVGSWLYTVAYRTALEARAANARRRARETQVETMPHPPVPPAEAQDWRPLLDRALNELPEKYRRLVVLCDLEGRTRRDVARQLGLAEGTLSSRLAAARRLLARRLSKSGLSLSGGALAVVLAERASAAVPAPLAVATVKAATLLAAGRAAGLMTPAAALMKEVLKTMFLTKLKVVVAVVMVATALGVSGLAYRASGSATAQAAPEGDKASSEAEALRRKVELLQINLDVVLEKVRAQEAELKTLRAQVAAGTAKARAEHALLADEVLRVYLSQAEHQRAARAAVLLSQAEQRTQAARAAVLLSQVANTNRKKPGAGGPGVAATPDPLAELEAALRDRRSAADKEAARQADVRIQKALDELRELLRQAKPASPEKK
jgi:RNA polymerase sigma factor (sigma-70 family)